MKKILHNGINFIGEKFGKLTLISFDKIVKGNAYYICKCECGKEKSIRYNSFYKGNTKSCGCFAKEVSSIKNSLPKGERAFNNTYYMYKYEAKSRNLVFEIDKDLFKKLTSSDCFYCGRKPSSYIKIQNKKAGYYFYNGLDRVNNNVGYIKENVVTCCNWCNKMKIHHSLEDFKKQIMLIYNKLIQENV